VASKVRTYGSSFILQTATPTASSPTTLFSRSPSLYPPKNRARAMHPQGLPPAAITSATPSSPLRAPAPGPSCRRRPVSRCGGRAAWCQRRHRRPAVISAAAEATSDSDSRAAAALLRRGCRAQPPRPPPLSQCSATAAQFRRRRACHHHRRLPAELPAACNPTRSAPPPFRGSDVLATRGPAAGRRLILSGGGGSGREEWKRKATVA